MCCKGHTYLAVTSFLIWGHPVGRTVTLCSFPALSCYSFSSPLFFHSSPLPPLLFFFSPFLYFFTLLYLLFSFFSSPISPFSLFFSSLLCHSPSLSTPYSSFFLLSSLLYLFSPFSSTCLLYLLSSLLSFMLSRSSFFFLSLSSLSSSVETSYAIRFYNYILLCIYVRFWGNNYVCSLLWI